MRILAIDPGTRESAWVVWNGSDVLSAGKALNQEFITHYERVDIRECVIEKIASYGMAVGAEVFETVFWSGKFAQFFESMEMRVSRIERRAVKLHLCCSCKAKDSNIRQALIDRFGAPGTKKAPGALYGIKGDMWAALAVAVTHWDNIHDPSATGSSDCR